MNRTLMGSQEEVKTYENLFHVLGMFKLTEVKFVYSRYDYSTDVVIKMYWIG